MNNTSKQKLLSKKDRLVIALDGPSAAGKGHIGRLIADRYNLVYFESSRTYRGLAYLCLQNNLTEDDLEKIITLSKKNILKLTKDADLFKEEIAQLASKISTISEVRKNLTEGLKRIVAENTRIIMEGRDISSMVAPDADIKIFMTADVKVRAERRYQQLIKENKPADMKAVLEALVERDKRDSERLAAPLIATPDALIVDTTNLSPDEVLAYILSALNK